MVFLGILDDKKLPHVPGTAILEASAAQSDSAARGLKHATGKNKNIILIPQPSDDPNDPLNWSQTKKWVALGITSLGSILYAAAISAMLGPAFYVMSIDLNTTISNIVLTTGWQTLVVALSGPLYSMLARKWGKRPVFVFSAVLCTVGNILGSVVATYEGLLAARVLQGFAMAPYESLIFGLISDMFFLHERGFVCAFVNFLLAGVSQMTGVVSGAIAAAIGWRWLFYLSLLFGVIHCVLQFLFVPETNYIRDRRFEIDREIDDNLNELVAYEHQASEDAMKAAQTAVYLENADNQSLEGGSPPTTPSKKTFFQQLKVFNGTFSDENVVQLMLAPLAILTNITILWVVVMNGIYVTFYVIIALVLAQLLSVPPYNLGPEAIGNIFYGPTIGSLIATVFLATTSDPFIKWCARRNGGVYEPEYRLVFSVFGLTCGVGLILFGWFVDQGISIYALATIHGFLLFGLMSILVSTSNYALDAFRGTAAEIFIMSMFLKNILIYGFAQFVNEWTAEAGVLVTFYTWGGMALGLMLTCPFFFFFGKKYRSFWARHNLLVKWKIRTHDE